MVIRPVLSRLFNSLIVIAVLAAVLWGAFGRVTSTGPAEGTFFLPSQMTSTSQPAPIAIMASHRGLRLGTFNIDGGQGIDGKLNLQRTARSLPNLDFIGLEEVHGSLFGSPANQAEALAAILKMPYIFAPAEHQWWHDSFGNAVLTTLPVRHWQRIVLPSGRLRAKRNYVLTEVDWRGHTLHVITTHVERLSGGDEQLRIVADIFLHQPEPAVLMGDLNHPESDSTIQTLLKTPGVEEAIHYYFPENFLKKQGSASLETVRVDWIFMRGLKTREAGIVDTHASDHPAYWAEVDIPTPPAADKKR